MKTNDVSRERAWRAGILVFALLSASFGFLALIGWVCGWPLLASFGAGLMPMAPSTAVLFLLFGAATGLCARTPLSRRNFWISVAAGCLGTLAALLLFVLSCLNIHWAVEHLGLNVTGTVGGAPVGHMSPVVAFCFLLAGASFLATHSQSAIRRWRVVLALGFAGMLLGTSLILMLAYLFGAPLLYGGTFIPPALNTVLAFTVLGLALLLLAIRSSGPQGGQPEDIPVTSHVFLLIFSLLTAGIVTVGYLYYRHYENQYRNEVERQLSAIAELKSDELTRWREERMGDGIAFFKNISFSALVRRLFAQPADVDAQRQILDWLGELPKFHDYDQVRLMDAQGVTRLSLPGGLNPATSDTLREVSEVLRSGQITLMDLYRHERNHRVYLQVMVPIHDELDASRPLGVVELRLDPAIFLYPFLKRWPTPSRTAETLLMRREGNEAVCLNDLRYLPNKALTLRLPLARTEVPEVRAALGQTGIMEGVDYRGTPVFVAVRAVSNSPWSLVCKMDMAEVYGPLRERLWQVVVLIAALLLGAGASASLLWRRQHSRFYRERHEAAETLRASELRYRRLFESAKDGILILDAKTGMVVDANPFLTEILGYSHEVFLGKKVWELGFFKDIIANEANFVELQQKEYIRYEDMALETSDGRRIEVEFVSNVYLVNHQKVIQCNIRDISQRKTHERAIERLTRLYATRSHINLCIIRAKTREEMFQEVCRITAQYSRFKLVWIGRHDPETHQIIPVAHAGDDPDYLDGIRIYADDRPEGRCPVGTCVRENKPCVFNDFLNDPRTAPWREKARIHGLRSAVAMPIHFKGEAWGVLAVYDKEAGVFQKEEVALLEEATADISYALENLDTETQRRQAEERFKLFRTLADRSNDAIEVVDPQTGRFLDVNEKGCADLGYSREELLSLKVFDIDPMVDPATFRKSVEELHASCPKVWNGVHRRKDGSEFPVEVGLSYARLDRDYIVAVVRDITERKRAEKTLHDSQQLYSSLVENLPQSVFRKDREGRFLFCNQRFCDSTGHSLEEVIGKTDADLFPSQLAGAYRQDDLRVMESGQLLDRVEEHVGADGRKLFVQVMKTSLRDADGAAVGIQGIFWDITERMRAEESHARLAMAIEQAAEAVMITDTSGTILYVNPAFERNTGYTRQEAVGQNTRFLKSGKQDAEFYRKMWETLVRGEVWHGHFINKRKDGTLYEEEATISSIRNAAGETINYVAIKLDVSREVAMEIQLRQSQKMEAIGTLAGGVAHEINNPINGIMNYAQLIADKLPADSKLQQYLTNITKETNRVSVIVRNLLSFARFDKHERSPANLNDIIKSTLTLVQTLFKQDQITLTVEVPEGLPQMECRSQQIEQVLMNLLTNARDALNERYAGYHDDKIIRISAQTFEKDGKPWIRTTVEDHANGMPEAVRDRVFDPFYTTKPAGKGTGLGLSISYGIVKEHGGLLHFETEAGRGTRFHMDLPLKI